MVTMKTKHFLGIVASAWMLAACSNQDELLQQDELVAKQCVTVNAYVPDDANSRLTFEDQGTNGLKVSWNESGESFSVMTAEEDEPATFTQTKGSEFEGPDNFEFDEGKDYYAYYPALLEGMLGDDPDTGNPLTTVSATAIPFDFYNQTGRLDENMNLMYAKRSAEGDFHFQHMLAVMKFTLKGIQGELVNTVDIGFYNESVEYFSIGKVDVTGDNPVFTAESPYPIVFISTDELVPDDDGNYVLYAYLPPLAADTEVTITAYSDHEGYHKTWRDKFIINNEEGIKAGYYYTAARTMDDDVAENVLLNHTARNVEDLKAWIEAVESYPNVNLTLTADIDLTGVAFDYDNDYNETNDSNWPCELMIAGTVDGGGHSITGIKIDSGEENQAAPFNIGSTGVVKNLHLKDVAISGRYAGGIATDNYGAISGCSVSGSVTTLFSGYSVGGIVNDNSGLVTGCYNIAEMKGVDSYVGGIAGYNYGTITACYNTGALSATAPDEETCIGGVVGYNYDTGIITDCYWNCTGATNGIGEDENSQTATEVDSTTVTWETAMEAMNTALPSDFGDWRYEPSTNENEPLILDKSGNNDYVPV